VRDRDRFSSWSAICCHSFHDFEELFFDKGIPRLCGALFALLCLGAVLFCFGRHAITPVGVWPSDDERGRWATISRARLSKFAP
jgi:hypothetical protein